MTPSSLPSRKVRIVLADDHRLVRAGIEMLLTPIEGVEVIGYATGGEELVRLVDELLPDLVLTDIAMPEGDGIAAMAAIRERHPAVRMVVLSMHNGLADVQRAIAAGACGYLRKDGPPLELEQAIRSVMATGTYFSPAITQQVFQREPAAQEVLTGRQLEVLARLVRGQDLQTIGIELGLSRRTVEAHRTEIKKRLNLRSLASLTRYALRRGLVSAW